MAQILLAWTQSENVADGVKQPFKINIVIYQSLKNATKYRVFDGINVLIFGLISNISDYS